ncbi:hypothetical protein WDW89_11690 [Deltaproteobacteria bacterium TL4]
MQDSPDFSYTEFKKKRPQWTTRVRRNLEYFVFCFGLFLGRKFSLERLQGLGRGLGKLAYHVLRKDRGIVEKQLAWIFPEIPLKQQQQWAYACFLHFGQGMLEFFAMEQIIRDFEKRVIIENEHLLENALNEGKGVILLALHMGNWELIVPYLLHRKYPTLVITTSYPDPRINQTLRAIRERENIHLIPRGDPKAAIAILRCFKRKEIFLLAIDQDTNVPSMFVPFFGHLAKSPIAVSNLAIRCGTLVISNVILRQPNGTFRLRFENIGTFDHLTLCDEDVFKATYEMNQHMEMLIRQQPEQWAWFHRRWRHRPNSEELLFYQKQQSSTRMT